MKQNDCLVIDSNGNKTMNRYKNVQMEQIYKIQKKKSINRIASYLND